MMHTEIVKDRSGLVIARILYCGVLPAGVRFWGDPSDTMQLGTHKWKAGHQIAPHYHNEITREIKTTAEVLMILSGRIRVSFYRADKDFDFFESRDLRPGDVVLFLSGGHGIEILEDDTEFVEVKQGPYAGVDDKVKKGA